MKRAIILTFLIVYLVPAIGLTFSVHFCGGKFSSVSIGFEDEHSCGCKSAHKKNCCRDNSIILKLKTEQLKPETALISGSVKPVYFIPVLLQPEGQTENPLTYNFVCVKDDPPKVSLDLFLFQRKFRV